MTSWKCPILAILETFDNSQASVWQVLMQISWSPAKPKKGWDYPKRYHQPTPTAWQWQPFIHSLGKHHAPRYRIKWDIVPTPKVLSCPSRMLQRSCLTERPHVMTSWESAQSHSIYSANICWAPSICQELCWVLVYKTSRNIVLSGRQINRWLHHTAIRAKTGESIDPRCNEFLGYSSPPAKHLSAILTKHCFYIESDSNASCNVTHLRLLNIAPTSPQTQLLELQRKSAGGNEWIQEQMVKEVKEVRDEQVIYCFHPQSSLAARPPGSQHQEQQPGKR
jgi:hypothetical protein